MTPHIYSYYKQTRKKCGSIKTILTNLHNICVTNTNVELFKFKNIKVLI